MLSQFLVAEDERKAFNILNKRRERIVSGGLLEFAQGNDSKVAGAEDPLPQFPVIKNDLTLSEDSIVDEKFGGCGCRREDSSDNEDGWHCCQPVTTTVTLTLTWSTTQTSFETSFIFSSTTVTSTITFTSSIPGPTFYFTYSYTSLTTSSSITTSTTTSSTTTSTTTTSTITISTSTTQTITIF